jgi:hypothetical protein
LGIKFSLEKEKTKEEMEVENAKKWLRFDIFQLIRGFSMVALRVLKVNVYWFTGF